MPRTKKRRINKDRSEATNIKPKTRELIECKCFLHCGGSKFVDPRTFERHRQEIERLQIVASGSRGSRNKPVNVESFPFYDDEYSSDDDEYSDGNEGDSDGEEDDALTSDNKPINVPKRRKRYNKFRDEILDEPAPILTEENVEDFGVLVDDDSTAEEADRGLSENDDPVEQFNAPDYDEPNFESNYEYSVPTLTLMNRGYCCEYSNIKQDFVFWTLPLIHLLNFLRLFYQTLICPSLKIFLQVLIRQNKLWESSNKERHMQYVQTAIPYINSQKFCHKM
jgi:hypothetical protein